MADNFVTNAGSGGSTFAADDVGGVLYPRSKLTWGVDGVAVDASATDPLPVEVMNFPATQPVSGTLAVSNFPATQPVSGTIAVSNMVAQGLTDAQLRATAVPVSGSVSVSNMVAQGLTDAQLRASEVGTAPTGDPVPYWPSYGPPTETGPQTQGVDSGGALVTRGAVLTDEGTFRANFANASLSVSIGSVTVSGLVVTGTGFDTTDVHYRDYFKLDADAESAWVQIESIDSSTQLTLRSSYVGGSSGAASRTLMRPVTGSGGAISVASGQATMTTGTTINANTRIVRAVDYAPLVFRGRVGISQRIANQTFRIGLSESFTASDKWFARFRAEGTSNTTVICESARNPTTTPSAAETETTTVTLPNGLTTAQNPEYRVEMLSERAVFYINGVQVAQHSRSIPSQFDLMEASVTCINGASAPATSTTVTVDYVTGKNHNKLEIGVMSDAEQILSASPPMAAYNYGPTAGVITINTDLMIIDCSQLRSLYIQCTSMGTTGVVTPSWSNDGITWVTSTLLSEAGATSTTFNAAVLRSTNVRARYFRLRLTTATTAGTTTIYVNGSQTDASPIVTTQPVSGTVTATVTAGTVNPVVPATPYFVNSLATTNIALILTGTSGMSAFWATNTGASVAFVKLYNKATAPVLASDVPEMIIPVPAAVAGVAGTASVPMGFHGFRFALGLGIAITGGVADTDTTAVAAGQVKVKLTRTV